jgi:hypothetical protein
MHRFDLSAKKSRDFNKKFTRAYLQYIAEFEGKNKGNINSKDKLSNAFVTLLIDITNKDTPYSSGSDSETFFTLIKGF